MAQSLINTEIARAEILDVLNRKSAYLTEGGTYADTLNEYAEEFAEHTADALREQMRDYSHRADTSITGNFKDIRRNYEDEHQGATFADLLARMDRDELTAEELATVQAWALSWMWEAFGTFGIYYNFDSMAGDLVYSWEQEDEAAAA